MSSTRATALFIILSLLGCVAANSREPANIARPADPCALTAEQKRLNAGLSFAEFDQAETTPSTARALANRGCYAEAAEAAEDYLAHVSLESERSQTSVVFHMAQNLAMAGNNDKAAAIVVGAKRPTQPPDADFDWNSYVVGTWAFLKKDLATLTQRYEHLRSRTSHPDVTNARVLGGLLHCFKQPYVHAYTPKCADLGAAARVTRP